jgi:hypothetical protein
MQQTVEAEAGDVNVLPGRVDLACLLDEDQRAGGAGGGVGIEKVDQRMEPPLDGGRVGVEDRQVAGVDRGQHLVHRPGQAQVDLAAHHLDPPVARGCRLGRSQALVARVVVEHDHPAQDRTGAEHTGQTAG